MILRHTAYRLLTLAAIFFFMPFSQAQIVRFDTIHQPVSTDTVVLMGQAVKSTTTAKPHSPKKAGILSACIPGAGQIYNRKWWKTPIVYAGLGGLGYMAYNNYSNYRLYLLAYRVKTGNLTEGEIPSEKAQALAERYQDSQLQAYKENYQRSFEIYTILSAVWYGLNIIDAVVDGHLYSYDISDDLSFNIDPNFSATDNTLPTYAQIGLSIRLNF